MEGKPVVSISDEEEVDNVVHVDSQSEEGEVDAIALFKEAARKSLHVGKLKSKRERLLAQLDRIDSVSSEEEEEAESKAKSEAALADGFDGTQSQTSAGASSSTQERKPEPSPLPPPSSETPQKVEGLDAITAEARRRASLLPTRADKDAVTAEALRQVSLLPGPPAVRSWASVWQ